MEAAYHGVPMICTPFFGDQYDNAYIAKRKGFAEVMNLDTITEDELVDIINRVISNQRCIYSCMLFRETKATSTIKTFRLLYLRARDVG